MPEGYIIPVRGPATKRIWAQFQLGYNSTFIWMVAVNLAAKGSNPIDIYFLLLLHGFTLADDGFE